MLWCTYLSPTVPRELAEQHRKHLVLFRTYEASREIGVLLMAFTPLDSALSPGGFGKNWRVLLILLLAGILLFRYGVLGESRIDNGE
jgi:hypothetical protein